MVEISFKNQNLVLIWDYEYTKVIGKERDEMIDMSPVQQDLDYRRGIDENRVQVWEMVMESYHDIATGKGRDCNEFFNELEEKYFNISK